MYAGLFSESMQVCLYVRPFMYDVRDRGTLHILLKFYTPKGFRPLAKVSKNRMESAILKKSSQRNAKFCYV